MGWNKFPASKLDPVLDGLITLLFGLSVHHRRQHTLHTRGRSVAVADKSFFKGDLSYISDHLIEEQDGSSTAKHLLCMVKDSILGISKYGKTRFVSNLKWQSRLRSARSQARMLLPLPPHAKLPHPLIRCQAIPILLAGYHSLSPFQMPRKAVCGIPNCLKAL